MFWNVLAGKAQKVNGGSAPHAPSVSQPVSNPSDLAVGVNGEATAIGGNTYASTSLHSRAYDRGAVQVAFGSATLVAAASSPAGQPHYAATNGYVEFAGADLTYTSTQKSSGSGSNQDGSWSTETTKTDYVALNVVGWDVDLGSTDHYVETGLGTGSNGPSIHGNVAEFNIDAQAYGDNSFVHGDNMSMALDGFASTTSYTMVGVGANIPGAKPIMRGAGNDLILSTSADTFISAGGGHDTVLAGKGDDWILAGEGNDVVSTGGGNNTVFAGAGNDAVTADKGDDWIFGGNGKDMIIAGAGNNIVHGGDGNDTIIGGSGDDAFIGGMGNDVITPGDGRNYIRLGLGNATSDGDDIFTLGRGTDLFFVDGSFGRDTVTGFAVWQGDRIVVQDGLDATLSIARSGSDPMDVVLTFGSGRGASVLTLDGFFLSNPGYAPAFSRASLTKAQVAAIRQDIITDGAGESSVQVAEEYFAIGDYLGLLG